MTSSQMSGASGRSGASRPLAFRLIEAGVRAEYGEVLVEERDIEMIPSGSARLAVLQAVSVATVAVMRLAAHEDRAPLAVLAELWPAEKRTTEAERERARRVVEDDV